MLASISPLGERTRGNRWGLTVAGYTVGSVAAAALLGLVLGAVGTVVAPGVSARWAMLTAVAAGSAVLDLWGRVPTIHRQVDERWLTRYRGWVYGAGFGAQLGVGLVTVVTTATVYAWLVACVLAGSPAAGVVVGAAFGIARSLPLAATARDDSPDRVRATVRGLAARASTARVVAVLASAGVSLASIVGWSRA